LNNQYYQLFNLHKHSIKSGGIGLFCNQVSYDFSERKYLFQLIAEQTDSLKVLVPEHGFFAELQDQEIVDTISHYKELARSASFISMYNNSSNRVGNLLKLLKEMNLLIIDIQDVGARYFTYLTTIAETFRIINDLELDIQVVLLDKPNLAGRQVEGSRLLRDFKSFIGWEGIPQRYGLTIGELSLFLNDQMGGNLNLEVIKYSLVEDNLGIYPSPNIPHPNTPHVYPGQCLLEGTNLSEGRGTTRPFEFFGAPFLKEFMESWIDDWNLENPEAILRPLLFEPTFHKYKGEKCWGFQLHPQKNYHSLLYSLKLLKAIKEECIDFSYREGPYEAGSDLTAIEILAGDDTILSYLKGEAELKTLINKLSEEEAAWIKLVQPFILYPEKLYQIRY